MRNDPTSIRARVRYLNSEWRDRSERARIGSRDTRRANTSFREVLIRDARPLHAQGVLDLDSSGFVLARHESAVRDFHDDAEVRRVYYPEIEALVRRQTQADRLFVLGHVVRTENPPSFNEAYARFVHSDYALRRCRELSHALLAQHDVELSGTRDWEFAWFNTWQPIEREVQQNPLTLLDASSLAEGDLVEYLYTGFGEDSPSSMPVYNAAHRFYYFPRMQPNEVMTFKQLDTREGRPASCPHTSFDDLTAPSDALGRRSIEVRLMCAFDTGRRSAAHPEDGRP